MFRASSTFLASTFRSMPSRCAFVRPTSAGPRLTSLSPSTSLAPATTSPFPLYETQTRTAFIGSYHNGAHARKARNKPRAATPRRIRARQARATKYRRSNMRMGASRLHKGIA